MNRNWNWHLWVGFVCALAGFFSYTFFVLFPITRDFPWVNLLLFAAGGILLIFGLVRAFGRPKLYRGKVFGSIFTIFALAMFGLFSYGLFYVARQMPPSTGAPRVGEKAPEFSLPDQDGKQVALTDLLASPGTQAVLLIFYRGYWVNTL